MPQGKGQGKGPSKSQGGELDGAPWWGARAFCGTDVGKNRPRWFVAQGRQQAPKTPDA